jgi:hypothetical protein
MSKNKLKHRCSVEGCWKCGKVEYDSLGKKKVYFCKKHNPTSKKNRGKEVECILKDGRNLFFAKE